MHRYEVVSQSASDTNPLPCMAFGGCLLFLKAVSCKGIVPNGTWAKAQQAEY